MKRKDDWSATAAAASRHRWLHATKREDLGESVLRSGSLLPPSETGVPTATGAAKPLRGRVYLTRTSAMAIDYAVGAWVGLADSHDRKEWADRMRRDVASGYEDRHAYVFEVEGGSLAGRGARGVMPDEDAFGYAYYRASGRLQSYGDLPGHVELDPDVMDYRWPGLFEAISSDLGLALEVNDAASVMSLHEQAGAESGDFKAWFSGGKKAVKRMGPGLATRLIDAGASISVLGGVKIAAAWRLDKFRLPEIKRDASNMREVCVRVA